MSKMLIRICYSINKISYKNTDAVVYSIKCVMMESINNQNIDSKNPLVLVIVMQMHILLSEVGKNT